jgi:hypothetical protein
MISLTIPGIYTTKEIGMDVQRGKRKKIAFFLKDYTVISYLKNVG